MLSCNAGLACWPALCLATCLATCHHRLARLDSSCNAVLLQVAIGVTQAGTYEVHATSVSMACMTTGAVLVRPEGWTDRSALTWLLAVCMGFQVFFLRMMARFMMVDTITAAVDNDLAGDTSPRAGNASCVLHLEELVRRAEPGMVPVGALSHTMQRVLQGRNASAFFPNITRRTLNVNALAEELESLQYMSDTDAPAGQRHPQAAAWRGSGSVLHHPLNGGGGGPRVGCHQHPRPPAVVLTLRAAMLAKC